VLAAAAAAVVLLCPCHAAQNLHTRYQSKRKGKKGRKTPGVMVRSALRGLPRSERRLLAVPPNPIHPCPQAHPHVAHVAHIAQVVFQCQNSCMEGLCCPDRPSSLALLVPHVCRVERNKTTDIVGGRGLEIASGLDATFMTAPVDGCGPPQGVVRARAMDDASRPCPGHVCPGKCQDVGATGGKHAR
jgi:hypothetical protein